MPFYECFNNWMPDCLNQPAYHSHLLVMMIGNYVISTTHYDISQNRINRKLHTHRALSGKKYSTNDLNLHVIPFEIRIRGVGMSTYIKIISS